MSARDYYDDFSSTYETERGRGYHALVDELETDIVLPFCRDADVLELGCGTGLILERVAKVAKTARGIDLSPGMLEKATARGLDVSLASVTELPFADASFDLVYSFKVLAHVPDIGRALAEAARVTRPGGHLVLEFYNPLSLRYLAKRAAGPQPIGDGRTEADVFTRWDPQAAAARRGAPGDAGRPGGHHGGVLPSHPADPFRVGRRRARLGAIPGAILRGLLGRDRRTSLNGPRRRGSHGARLRCECSGQRVYP